MTDMLLFLLGLVIVLLLLASALSPPLGLPRLTRGQVRRYREQSLRRQQ